jgi:hypothetical protein
VNGGKGRRESRGSKISVLLFVCGEKLFTAAKIEIFLC